jgi:hypothetical protein
LVPLSPHACSCAPQTLTPFCTPPAHFWAPFSISVFWPTRVNPPSAPHTDTVRSLHYTLAPFPASPPLQSAAQRTWPAPPASPPQKACCERGCRRASPGGCTSWHSGTSTCNGCAARKAVQGYWTGGMARKAILCQPDPPPVLLTSPAPALLLWYCLEHLVLVGMKEMVLHACSPPCQPSWQPPTWPWACGTLTLHKPPLTLTVTITVTLTPPQLYIAPTGLQGPRFPSHIRRHACTPPLRCMPEVSVSPLLST